MLLRHHLWKKKNIDVTLTIPNTFIKFGPHKQPIILTLSNLICSDWTILEHTYETHTWCFTIVKLGRSTRIHTWCFMTVKLGRSTRIHTWCFMTVKLGRSTRIHTWCFITVKLGRSTRTHTWCFMTVKLGRYISQIVCIVANGWTTW